MQRDPAALETELFDVAVIGAGMFGAAVALDAARRGFRVALIERGDFCGATSAHSFKMVHGGIRYLQHVDVKRIRQSARARALFLRLAPHLVRPLPIVVPTYGRGMRSKAVLRAGMAAYDVMTLGRNRGITDPERQIHAASFLSRDQVIERYPGLAREGLTGAGVFCDGQMYNPPRLVLAFVRSAVAAGAVCVNYVEATHLLQEEDRVVGVQALDRLSGASLRVRARLVLNAGGPYAEALLNRAGLMPPEPPTPFSRDAWFLVPRPLIKGDCALTVPSQTHDPDALFARGSRHLFLVPWRGTTLVGVWHKVYPGHPDRYEVTRGEIENWIREIRTAYTGLDLDFGDVTFASAGLVPFGENDPNAKNLRFAHRSRIIDHAAERGPDGLVTLIGVRYTTGPSDAIDVVDLLARKLGNGHIRSALEAEPVHGGNVANMADLVATIMREGPCPGDRAVATALACNFGSAWRPLLAIVRDRPQAARRLAGSTTVGAEIVNAIENEMAVTLADIIFRRTDLCTAGPPPPESVAEAASIAAETAGWSPGRRAAELAFVNARLAMARSGRMLLATGDVPSLEPAIA